MKRFLLCSVVGSASERHGICFDYDSSLSSETLDTFLFGRVLRGGMWRRPEIRIGCHERRRLKQLEAREE
jgi:hypothetical protein